MNDNTSDKLTYASFCRRNKRIAQTIVERIQEQGCRVWFVDNTEAEDDVITTSRDIILNCSCVLAFISRAFSESDRCCEEIVLAADNQVAILPIFLDCNEFPDYLGENIRKILCDSDPIYLRHYKSDDITKNENFLFQICSRLGISYSPVRHQRKEDPDPFNSTKDQIKSSGNNPNKEQTDVNKSRKNTFSEKSAGSQTSTHGKYHESDDLKKYYDSLGPDIKATLKRGDEFLQNGQIDQADAIYRCIANDISAEHQSVIGFSFILNTFKGDDEVIQNGYDKAMFWYKLAAENGDSYACSRIGDMYRDGEGVEQNYKEAISWYELAAENGDIDALCSIGDMYRHGKAVEKNFEEALKWYNIATEKNSPRAQTDIGYMYSFGRGVKKSERKALQWYTLSAENGYEYAQKKVGDFYYEGRGTIKNYKKAMYWYTCAAEQGNGDAQMALGNMFRDGKGVPVNYEEARKWYTLAMENGNKKAGEALADLNLNQ